jgi:glutamine cyclotransferase
MDNDVMNLRSFHLFLWFCTILVMTACSAAAPATPTALPALPSPTPPTATPTPASTAVPSATTATAPQYYGYSVVATYPHDPNAFTQGLLFDGDQLIEGTGLYGESTLRRVELITGEVVQQIALPEQYFGEGVAMIDNRLYQLTWQEGTGFIYDKATFEQLDQFSYTTQGWGLTYDGNQLILSDGSDQLYFLDPATLTVVDQVSVSLFDPADQTRKGVPRLNELEYIDGQVFANVWQTDVLVRIDPKTGNVTGVIDLSGLLPAADRSPSTDVLNGIAYLPTEQRLFVTGKKWPKLFEIRLVEQ